MRETQYLAEEGSLKLKRPVHTVDGHMIYDIDLQLATQNNEQRTHETHNKQHNT